MGKKITFIAFLLALLCLLPSGIYTLIYSAETLPIPLGMITIFGLPLFASLSFIGMIIWAISEIRRPGAPPGE